MLEMLKSVFEVLFWLVKNPQMILYGWLGLWAILLYMSMRQQGLIGAIQLSMVGMLNLSSIMGLPIPLMALFLMFMKYIIPMILKLVVSGATSLFKMVQSNMLKGVKNIKKAFKKLKTAVDDQQQYLGSSVDDEQSTKLKSALQELESALLQVYAI